VDLNPKRQDLPQEQRARYTGSTTVSLGDTSGEGEPTSHADFGLSGSSADQTCQRRAAWHSLPVRIGVRPFTPVACNSPPSDFHALCCRKKDTTVPRVGA
jgi:hypothetical protein